MIKRIRNGAINSILPLVVIVAISLPFGIYGQTILPDSTTSEEEIVDTLFVKKDPFIIRKTISYHGKKSKIVKNNNIEFFVNGDLYSNYYANCPECASFLKIEKNSHKPILSWGGGIAYSYSKKWFYISTAVNFSCFREKFRYTDSLKNSYNNNNTVNYLGINLGIGLRLIQKKKIELFFIPEIGYVRLLSTQGKSFLSATDMSVVELSSIHRYSDYGCLVVVGIKFNYQLTERLKLFVEPYYQGDLTSITKYDQPFLAQKIVIGSRVGIIYPF
jgi:hypothetical protein